MAEDQCIFCLIAQGNIPAKTLYEDNQVIAVLDINPAVPGHILLFPKNHIAVMPQMNDELTAHIGMIAKQLSASVIRSLKAEGTTIFVANGAVAGQRAPHFIMHIIPRANNDGINLQLPEGKLDDKTMNLVFARLAPAVSKNFGVALKAPESPKESKQEAKAEEKLEKKEPRAVPKPSNSLDSITDFLTGGKT